ncbi:hypothetical protein [Phenylobacterium sp.]|uniref:hypothetical protein n=1 Tax=Phenylobacterium sp. TaxID=1871053 RepID=UPI0025DFD806|nr:hypothetical protein [Phenylobacterium sp.]
MSTTPMDTILLVCRDADYSVNLIGSLQDIGASVVGPVSDGDTALALAAQTSPNLAIVADDPTCDRDAEGLARELHAMWGVRSLVLDDRVVAIGEQPWLPEPEALDRLIDTLAQAEAAKLQ